MQRKIKTTNGETIWISETIRLGHDTYDRNDPIAYEKIWVLHNTEGPALIKKDNTKEFDFWGIFQGTNPDVIKDLKRDQIGLPPAKNPLFKDR